MLVAVAALMAGCSSSHMPGSDGDIDELDAGTTHDAGPPIPAEDAGPGRDTGVRDAGAVPEPPVGVTACGGRLCATGEACCALTVTCFDPAIPAECAVPDEVPDPDACASNLDCAAGELCERGPILGEDPVEGPACGGALGVCVMMRDPTMCAGFDDGVCGCDGRTYDDPCAASRAGVRVALSVPCGSDEDDADVYLCDAAHPTCMTGWTCDIAAGRCVEDARVVACGFDAQCPAGQFCCGLVGLCMTDEARCAVPPDGTSVPCLDNSDCIDTDGFDEAWYCDRVACGALGGCRRRGSACTGELAPVCGCDDLTYSNRCWASEARASVRTEGACP